MNWYYKKKFFSIKNCQLQYSNKRSAYSYQETYIIIFLPCRQTCLDTSPCIPHGHSVTQLLLGALKNSPSEQEPTMIMFAAEINFADDLYFLHFMIAMIKL